MKKKEKTHSTQRMYFGTIPRSEFYGFVLGYALGLFISGFLRLDSQYQNILFACVGFGIGYVIDQKYYREPDKPSAEEDPETADEEAGTEAEDAAEGSDRQEG